MKVFLLAALLACSAFANPYFDPAQVPQDPPLHQRKEPVGVPVSNDEGIAILRVDLNWNKEQDVFAFSQAVIEKSGTPALLKRAPHPDVLGSYRGEIVSGKNHYYDSLGTGQEFRRLTRALTFRFPLPDATSTFTLSIENPSTGVSETALTLAIDPHTLTTLNPQPVEIRLLQPSQKRDSLKVNFYADGYQDENKEDFFSSAQRAIDALKSHSFPDLDKIEFKAVFAPSKKSLGGPKDLGMPIAERDSFLGLYYPYWDNFGRWYNIVYPTREAKYRNAIGSVAYDYPIALIDDDHYWGIGNFNELTAIPTQASQFSYLLIHEFGHYFGLNEEYEGGGPTELAFAPSISEPWSQNITFATDLEHLKWKSFVKNDTPIPTASSYWDNSKPYGLYQGGYADTEPLHHSHKPGFGCVMNNGRNYCPICHEAIEKKINFDLGE